MTQPWTEEEVLWARECHAAGDTIEEIADAANRCRADIVKALGKVIRLTDTERAVLSLYSAGVSLPDIDRGRGTYSDPGKAAAMVISTIRRKGLSVPHRREDLQGRAA